MVVTTTAQQPTIHGTTRFPAVAAMQHRAVLPCGTRHARSTIRAATARSGLSNISLTRLPGVEQSQTVVERRAADVCVVGGSCTAVLAAYSIAKTGRKVVLLSDYGLSAAMPAPVHHHPLKLTDPDALLVHLASESAAYWRGVELLAGSPLLSPHHTCDIVVNPERDCAGALGFNKLQAACQSAGVPAVPLSSSELMSRYRQLSLPADSSGLMQPDGAVLNATDITAAVQTLADRAGVVSRPGLLLQGWRDRGSYFELRASSQLSPELLSEIESEVILLAPEHWTNECINMFGLQLEGLQTREVLSCRVPAGILQQQQQQPLWQYWGAATAADALQQPQGACGLPLLQDSYTGWLVHQLPAWGVPVEDPFKWQPAAQAWAARQKQAQQGGNQQILSGLDTSSSSSGGCAQLQIQQLHSTCQQLVRDAGPVTSTVPSRFLCSCTEDGRPVVGQHPGFDTGRMVIACGVSGLTPYGPGSSSSSFHLSSILAKLAADLVKSAGAAGVENDVLQGLQLQRNGLRPVVNEVVDSWEQLSVLQNARPLLAEQIEQQQDEAADRRQDLANLDRVTS